MTTYINESLSRTDLITLQNLVQIRLMDLQRTLDEQAQDVARAEAGSDDHRIKSLTLRANCAYKSELRAMYDKLDWMIDLAAAHALVS